MSDVEQHHYIIEEITFFELNTIMDVFTKCGNWVKTFRECNTIFKHAGFCLLGQASTTFTVLLSEAVVSQFVQQAKESWFNLDDAVEHAILSTACPGKYDPSFVDEYPANIKLESPKPSKVLEIIKAFAIKYFWNKLKPLKSPRALNNHQVLTATVRDECYLMLCYLAHKQRVSFEQALEKCLISF